MAYLPSFIQQVFLFGERLKELRYFAKIRKKGMRETPFLVFPMGSRKI